jgi:hypothetical protein
VIVNGFSALIVIFFIAAFDFGGDDDSDDFVVPVSQKVLAGSGSQGTVFATEHSKRVKLSGIVGMFIIYSSVFLFWLSILVEF